MLSTSDPFAALVNKQNSRLLLAYICGIRSDRNRSALRLRYFDGMTTPEIAESLNVSEGNVSVYIQRGCDDLRRILEIAVEECGGTGLDSCWE